MFTYPESSNALVTSNGGATSRRGSRFTYQFADNLKINTNKLKPFHQQWKKMSESYLCAGPSGIFGGGWSRSAHSESNLKALLCSRYLRGKNEIIRIVLWHRSIYLVLNVIGLLSLLKLHNTKQMKRFRSNIENLNEKREILTNPNLHPT